MATLASPSITAPCTRVARRSRGALVVVRAAGKKAQQAPSGKGLKGGASLDYGNDWYTKTRELAKPRTVREEIASPLHPNRLPLPAALFAAGAGAYSPEYRRQANLIANNGKERKDLYTDNWDGSEYKGSPFNILTLVGALFILTPVAGLVFAYWSYGTLWG
ncbi:hypothetical protein GPECTOR_68g356 [Gonium pectorale]|uniref:Uncharacterized protein n=1 Tax=Gonium pectorale TaxID=33097 RepID=A0A150G4D4_GONPE|nr:hypothetical protein GPECTOR_68g356 [Gonium pectorale]|eukprot:KXZ44385.1 hypothetical protein GPECTOR_68g356 [Gonium pectorale]